MARGPDPKGARPQRQPGRALAALLAILGELADGGQQRLREVLDTNHRVRRVQGGDEVQPHLAMVGWPPSTSVSIAAMSHSRVRAGARGGGGGEGGRREWGRCGGAGGGGGCGGAGGGGEERAERRLEGE